MNRRFPELKRMYYAYDVKVLFHLLTPYNNPWAVEQCEINETPDAMKSPLDREISEDNMNQRCRVSLSVINSLPQESVRAKTTPQECSQKHSFACE